MKNYLLSLAFCCTAILGYCQPVDYLFIEEKTESKSYFDTTIVDDYMALEDVHSDFMEAWIGAQNTRTEEHLKIARKKYKGYSNIKRLGYADFNLPRKQGDYYIKFAYLRDDRTPSVLVQRGIHDRPRILINPREISWGKNIYIRSCAVSKNNKYMAFAYDMDGSDWQEIRVHKMNSDNYLDDVIKDVKFSGPVWQGDGFYYLKYPRISQFAGEQSPELYYHVLGNKQEEDELVFKKEGDTFYDIDFQVTDDERFLLVYEKNEAEGKLRVYVKDFEAKNAALTPLFANLDTDLSIIGNDAETLYALTAKKGLENTIVKFDIDSPTNWQMAIPPMVDAVLVDASILNNLFVCEYIQKTAPLMLFFNKKGEVLKSLPFEGGYAVNGFYGNTDDTETIYYITSYHVPPVVFTLDLNSFESELIEKTTVSFKPTDYEIKNLEYPSEDGTMVPLTIFSKKGLRQNGKNPMLLKTYGGFGSIHFPSFDEGLLFFLKKGGVFAYAHVRGEGNLGPAWVAGGKNLNKQNSIDDFIAAAEYLIAEKYTNPSKLAITGGSNGGMMVGAAMIQRPDLFKVAVPIVGVFDMLTAENNTVGSFHKDVFGTVEKKDEFLNLLSYSPYHKIKAGVNYPTTLIMTSENDDRVPPFQSYKFAAKLQHNPGQSNSIYLRVQKSAGHYGAMDIKGDISEQADMYSFILYHLNREE